ncbi:hypothetical protein BDZ85DRAFT_298036 [Elsinoe ampelina]|uniref:Uncharacterized protein n=1 Tax=Elsinoe ampelina TaxID=302913 RepID=A0A6A6G4F0_9PEZI|nr:hypothetical protein BDZ85DRAFT_298036 [Elsinoe ampelina]
MVMVGQWNNDHTPMCRRLAELGGKYATGSTVTGHLWVLLEKPQATTLNGEIVRPGMSQGGTVFVYNARRSRTRIEFRSVVSLSADLINTLSMLRADEHEKAWLFKGLDAPRRTIIHSNRAEKVTCTIHMRAPMGFPWSMAMTLTNASTPDSRHCTMHMVLARPRRGTLLLAPRLIRDGPQRPGKPPRSPEINSPIPLPNEHVQPGSQLRGAHHMLPYLATLPFCNDSPAYSGLYSDLETATGGLSAWYIQCCTAGRAIYGTEWCDHQQQRGGLGAVDMVHAVPSSAALHTCSVLTATAPLACPTFRAAKATGLFREVARHSGQDLPHAS